MLTKDNVKDVYALTPMQEGMLVEYARDPQAGLYVEQFDFVMEGTLDIGAVRKSFTALVAKYDVLRTIFSFRKTDQPRQVVLRERVPEVAHHDLSALDEAAAQAEVDSFKVADRERGFNISADLLVRLSVLSLSASRHRMVLSFHHIILDGWCFGPLFEDFFAWYDRFCAEPDAVVEDREEVPYGAYIRWLAEQDRSRAHEHWARYLDGYQAEVGAPYFDIAYDGPITTAEHSFSLGSELSQRLTALARDSRATLNGVFQAAWGVLLQRYNGTDDVVFGTVVSGRPADLAGVDRMIGLFINTQPLRVACAADTPFVELLRHVHRDIFTASAYEYYPLANVQAASPLKNRLINHVVTFENFPLSQQMRLLSANSKGLRVTDVHVFQAAKFDFHVIVFPGDELRVSFVYNGSRYRAATIESFARSLRCLLEAIAAQPQTAVGHLPVCAPEDGTRVLEVLNDTRRDYPAERSVIELFEETAAAYPQAPAVREGDRVMSYAELRCAAIGFAHRLRDSGVGSGDTVGLLAPRSTEMVVGWLAALYCGAAYLPLELHAGAERLRVILQDAQARLLCLHPAQLERAPADIPVLALAGFDEPAPTEPPIAAGGPGGDRPAYVMYTSGSTGMPKGCLVTHRNVVRLVRNTDYLPFEQRLRILQTGSPAFDASTFEVWGALLNGGELVLVDEATLLDARLLREALARHRVDALWLTSALFNQLCDSDEAMFGTLRHLVVGGDALSPRHIERVRAASPGLRIVNGYGPTENTTFSASFEIDRPFAGRIPIGRPIANSTAYVLDAMGALLPPGACGELCVGGDGVALGYLNRPELTQQKFGVDPFRPGGRLYRTGDIVRWLPDGTLDLLGRNDSQVKVRGFRVELGEIERALARHPGITDVAVIAHEAPGGGGKQLHAFYTSEADLAPAVLRASLSALPSYMVPSFYLRLDRMPLTINGKLDRRALPVERSLAARAVPAALEPRGQTAQRIAEICRQVLGVEDIGLHENFFEAGANSLNLIAINNRLKEAFTRDLPLAVLFEHTSVARLAEYLDAGAAIEQARAADENRELDESRNAMTRTRNLMKRMEEA